ncbi:MAG: hypothetical protein ACKOC4_06485 [Planctomycetia bacterium]
MRRPLGSAIVGLALAGTAAVAAAAPPARSLVRLDDEFTAAARDLARRAEAGGFARLAALVAGWPLPAEADRQLALAIPASAAAPEWLAADERPLWDDFVAARKARAAGLFDHALAAAAEHDRVASRDEQAQPDAERPPLPQRSCAVLRQLYQVIRDDPDHERARAALGWTRRGDRWVWPEAGRRLDRGEEFDPAFGWLPKGRLARYRAGERYDRGRWVTAAEDAARRDLPVDRGRRFDSDHWEILSPAPLEAAASVAARLEETFLVWQQVFGTFALEPADLEKRLRGRGRLLPGGPFAAVLCADQGQYVAELEQLEPTIGRTDGLYWPPTKTAWFFAAPAADDAEARPAAITVLHEATHQLFSEASPTTKKLAALAGERCGFWAIEAAACYMESVRPAAFGWTVGGRDTGRVPAARERLVEDDLYVPLAELTALGRKAFQADPRLPQLYSQIAGLADFFMNADRGRWRESFVEYLGRVYAGTADPETLSRLCRQKYADLDAAYRRHLSQ